MCQITNDNNFIVNDNLRISTILSRKRLEILFGYLVTVLLTSFCLVTNIHVNNKSIYFVLYIVKHVCIDTVVNHYLCALAVHLPL